MAISGLIGFVFVAPAAGFMNVSQHERLLILGIGTTVGTLLGGLMASRRWSAGMTVVWSVMAWLAAVLLVNAVEGPDSILPAVLEVRE